MCATAWTITTFLKARHASDAITRSEPQAGAGGRRGRGAELGAGSAARVGLAGGGTDAPELRPADAGAARGKAIMELGVDRRSLDKSVDGLMPNTVDEASRRRSNPQDEMQRILAYKAQVPGAPAAQHPARFSLRCRGLAEEQRHGKQPRAPAQCWCSKVCRSALAVCWQCAGRSGQRRSAAVRSA